MAATADKTLVDDIPLSVESFAAKASAKVQLDIDDAPFLIDDEPVALPTQADFAAQASAEAAEQEKLLAAQRKRKKLIIIGLGSLVILVAFAVAGYLLFWPSTTDTLPPESGPTVVVVPSPESIAGPQEFPIDFEAFWVPQKDANGQVRFLRAHFSSVTLDDKLVREIKDKTLTLRDAIYYYLRNKSHEFMLSPTNVSGMKQDILDIINSYLTRGKLEALFLENYIMK